MKNSKKPLPTSREEEEKLHVLELIDLISNKIQENSKMTKKASLIISEMIKINRKRDK